MMKWIGVGVLVIAVATAGGLYSFLKYFYLAPASTSSDTVYYELAAGATISSVARDMGEQKLVKNGELFLLVMRANGIGAKLKVGEYALRRDMTPKEIIAVLTSGKSVGRNFTVSEGLNIFEIADLFEAGKFGTREEFLEAARDQERIKDMLGEEVPSFEGYLYPDTYQITKYMHAQALITKMVDKFLEAYKAFVPMEKKIGMTRREVVTLASIVEKETGDPRERPMISSIFHNRMRIGMKLQTDPTILYGKALDSGSYIINITRKDLQADHPYNTYSIKGLPPSPIANPGREALHAAVNPAQSRYLFFVSQNDGTHIFSETYEGHARAVKRFQLDPKAREGKSWRDLNKKPAPGSAP